MSGYSGKDGSPMKGGGIDHIALRVESLRQAENLYTTLFGMQVVERFDGEAGTESRPGRSVLEGEGLRLVLFRHVDEFAGAGRLKHVCVRVPEESVAGLLLRAGALGCVVRTGPTGRRAVEDPYDVCWEIDEGK